MRLGLAPKPERTEGGVDGECECEFDVEDEAELYATGRLPGYLLGVF